MPTKITLKIIFGSIFLTLLAMTTWASLHQSVLHWGGLISGPDRYWTMATLVDAYGGFLTFYVWVFYKETHWLKRVLWFIAIAALGNMAMSAYVLLELMRLDSTQDANALLLSRHR